MFGYRSFVSTAVRLLGCTTAQLRTERTHPAFEAAWRLSQQNPCILLTSIPDAAGRSSNATFDVARNSTTLATSWTALPGLVSQTQCRCCRLHGLRRAGWATFRGWCVGILLCTLAGAGVVLCRPYDTPPYLIPYYLRDVRSRFQHYASVQKRKGGPLYMTVEDFVLALLASPEKELANPAIVEDLQVLFESMDANADGYISFPEFRFLMGLLTSDPHEMATLFRIADVDGCGSLTLEDFANVLRGVTKDEAVVRSLLKPSTRRNGVVRSLFGSEESPRRCTYTELAAVIHNIRTEVWKAEFRQYDVEKNNSITAEEFAELIAHQVLGSHLPYYLVNNIRKLRGTGDVVTLNMWLGLNEVMLHADELSTNVEMFSSSGAAVTKLDFRRLMRIAEMPALPKETVDLVFAVFDKNNDGTMEMDEFLFVMRKKVKYHYSVPPRDRKTLPRRFFECAGAALADWEK
jgi:calcium uptake protein 1, mitochondrial